VPFEPALGKYEVRVPPVTAPLGNYNAGHPSIGFAFILDAGDEFDELGLKQDGLAADV
jgi:hypothetical protein